MQLKGERLKMETYLMHHGIKGQKWGNRRFQYEDGSLTPEGRKRYGGVYSRREEKYTNKANRYKYGGKKFSDPDVTRKINNSKKVLKSEASDKKIMANRSENREKWATKYINAGNKKYNDIIKNYAKNKSLAKMSKDYKKSDAYKKAAKEYFNQKLRDAYFLHQLNLLYSNSYNPSLMTKMQYSSDMPWADEKKEKQLKKLMSVN